jgi:hypothetical protein
MSGLDKEGRYRVLLIRIGDNTEEEKDIFCHNLSKNYSIPFPLLKKIVDHSPIVLKKNLSIKKAEILAKTFKAFGATVSIEKRKESPPVSLEFQELVPHQLDLESSYLQKTDRGLWSVIGRVKNISDETLYDTWVLIQLFDNFEEFITFEETPLPINPLPSGETSPFKVVFEKDFPIKRISVGFKNASGQPIAALDKRKKKEWEEVGIGEDDEFILPTTQIFPKGEEKPQLINLYKSTEHINKEGDKVIQQDPALSFRQEAKSFDGEVVRGGRGEDDEGSSDIMSAPLLSSIDILSNLRDEDENQLTPYVPEELKGELDKDTILNGSKTHPDKEETDGSHLEASMFKESIQPSKVISEEIISEKDQKVSLEEKVEGKREEAAGKEDSSPFPWIENFRDAVATFYQNNRDIFLLWFEEHRKKGEFKNSIHSILTILLHSRFDQGDQSIKPLENTQRVFRLITHPNLFLEDIPSLEGTPFVSGEVWKDLFHRAIPKIQQIGNAILERKKWIASDLEQVIQVIPHMGYQNSQKAIQWINELVPDVVEVDLSNSLISVGESLYRVASRLGIVDPDFDFYQGRHSPGDIKIQSFAKMGFPHNPMRAEKPMALMGRVEEHGGHCLTTQPQCKGCLFEAFCPKLYIHFDPSGKGIRD